MNDLYPIRIYPVEEIDGIEWIAEYPDLPGCIGVGDSREDAIQEGEENKEMWLEAARRAGDPIPEPSSYPIAEIVPCVHDRQVALDSLVGFASGPDLTLDEIKAERLSRHQ